MRGGVESRGLLKSGCGGGVMAGGRVETREEWWGYLGGICGPPEGRWKPPDWRQHSVEYWHCVGGGLIRLEPCENKIGIEY